MKTIITDFNRSHMEMALAIAKAEYDKERIHVPALPEVDMLPGLEHFADNNLGVAAFEGERMLGFLGAYYPTEDHFGSTKVRGTFSPVHAHGVIQEPLTGSNVDRDCCNRERIYSLLYQEAAKKWVGAGIRSHAIALYTHDQEAVRSFFYNGFGLRCIDAVRSLDEILQPLDICPQIAEQINYREVPREEWKLLLEQNNALIAHLGESPAFMKHSLLDITDFQARNSEHTRYVAAESGGSYIAYLKLDKSGENFATETGSMMNICGAYCMPAYRGSGIYHNLLSYTINTLREEGYRQLGVDCESFNPTARGFWLKYFTEYTHSVVRRIDDKTFS